MSKNTPRIGDMRKKANSLPKQELIPPISTPNFKASTETPKSAVLDPNPVDTFNFSNIDIPKEVLIELARKKGLSLEQKKIWVKHSYTVTPDDRIKFKEYCRVLGYKMQDAMEEALSDFFKKHESRYNKLSQP